MTTEITTGTRVVLTDRWVDNLARTLDRLGMDSDTSRIRGISATVVNVATSYRNGRTSYRLLFDNATDGVAVWYPKSAVKIAR